MTQLTMSSPRNWNLRALLLVQLTGVVRRGIRLSDAAMTERIHGNEPAEA